MNRVLTGTGLAIACIVLAVFLLFPLYYAVLTSFKAGSELFRVDYWPTEIDFSSYIRIWQEQPFARNILNSIFVATTVVILSLGLALTAAYALGRVQFRGRKFLLYTILGVSMFLHVALLSV